jgi:hypothetical protein
MFKNLFGLTDHGRYDTPRLRHACATGTGFLLYKIFSEESTAEDSAVHGDRI